MTIQHNISLRPYNTFSIEASAASFVVVRTLSEVEEVFESGADIRLLGGGSNILLTGPVNGLVVCNRLKGIQLLKQDDRHVWLRVSSGEIWHELVMYTVEQAWGGLENLALIPGTVGAAPIQNIGAYGVEVQSVIEEVHCYHITNKQHASLKNAACRFGYRDSIFKNELKGQVFISAVDFKLSKKPAFNTSYGAIEKELERMGVQEPSVAAIAQAVINIRSSKLPDPTQIGNAGSFFKNPAIPSSKYEALTQSYPEIPSYPLPDGEVKVPAGWLIEQCGWKGYRNRDAGVHSKQALVLVNYADASGGEINKLADEIATSVHNKFGIELEKEVQIW